MPLVILMASGTVHYAINWRLLLLPFFHSPDKLSAATGRHEPIFATKGFVFLSFEFLFVFLHFAALVHCLWMSHIANKGNQSPARLPLPYEPKVVDETLEQRTCCNQVQGPRTYHVDKAGKIVSLDDRVTGCAAARLGTFVVHNPQAILATDSKKRPFMGSYRRHSSLMPNGRLVDWEPSKLMLIPFDLGHRGNFHHYFGTWRQFFLFWTPTGMHQHEGEWNPRFVDMWTRFDPGAALERHTLAGPGQPGPPGPHITT
ncbi:hypothetical protein M011DRAFT_461141 [Sporormia fimetaria CBS 119925]|uniref:Uncharacterized protein n=1 Tax=Sporormia fimetaria CBS 119925 TaxID=1340428 RepID=A0A6A6V0Q6_9PLEO|nr:hypothetical protein M011DRAFT_461141 [Sporormia fimetaria CBS 119925]